MVIQLQRSPVKWEMEIEDNGCEGKVDGEQTRDTQWRYRWICSFRAFLYICNIKRTVRLFFIYCCCFLCRCYLVIWKVNFFYSIVAQNIFFLFFFFFKVDWEAIVNITRKRFNVYCSLEAKGRKTKPVECKTYKNKSFFFCCYICWLVRTEPVARPDFVIQIFLHTQLSPHC